MSRQIFVNLPVENLPRSMEFFTGLGFTFNQQFTDDTAACMVVSKQIFVMLLTHEKFSQFTPTPISDARERTEVLVALSCESRAEVDTLVRQALAHGGTTYAEPKDYGFMYQHGFRDPDGHLWELFFMDLNAIPSNS